MTQVLKQSTQIKVRIGPFVDVGDAFTPETGITLSGADEAELLKADGAATVDISGATWAAISGSDGWYDLTLTTSHTDTVGTLEVVVQDDSVCLPVHKTFQVVEEATFDFLYGSGATPIADINAEVDTAISDAALATAAALATVDTVVDGIQTDLDNGTDGLGALKAAIQAADLVIETDTAQAGAATTITLASGASATDDLYNGLVIVTTGGTGALQARLILDYNGTTKVASVYPNFVTNPSSDTTYNILAHAAADVRLWRGGTPDVLNGSGLVDVNLVEVGDTAQTAGDIIGQIATAQADLDIITGADGVNLLSATQASIDAIEADTNELQTDDVPGLIAALNDFDPTSETVNVGEISGDSVAADKLEAMLDGIFTAAAEGTPSTTVIQTDLAETTDDIYIGRKVTFLTGNSAGEQTDITDYTGSTGTITVTALAATPTAGDLMVIH